MFSQELSREEEAELRRSTKKVKEYHSLESRQETVSHGVDLHAMAGSNGVSPSFKDKLIGEIPGAYVQAFDFSEYIEDEMEAEPVVETLREGFAAVKISKELKQHIRAPWSKALIITVYGRTVGFNYLSSKILALWKPKGKIDCIDLGFDFFLVRFSMKDDHDLVLKKGPWFIGEHFLSIRPWEPNFRPDTANIASVAVWVRLPLLPIEYYHPEALKEIGQAIGTVLRIDTTQYRKQEVALQDWGFQQRVTYEGISKLCFSCGRVGHRREACHYTISQPAMEKPRVDSSTRENNGNVQVEDTSDKAYNVDEDKNTTSQPNEDTYGPWIVVARKRNAVRNGRKDSGSGTSSKANTDPVRWQSSEVAFQTVMGQAKEGKRKSSGMEELTKEKSVLGGLSNSPIHKIHDIRYNYGQKGKAVKGQVKSTFGQKGKVDKGQIRDSTLSKQSASSSKNPFDTDTTNTSFSTSPPNFTDGSFKFTSEPVKEDRGDQSTQQVRSGLVHSHPSKSVENHLSTIGEQYKGGNKITNRSGVAINGANLEGVQVRTEGEICGSMEECAAAFAGANLRRIQPKSTSNGREDEGMQLKGDDDGGNHAVGYSDAEERLLQGEDATVRMELEGSGVAQPSC
ncbi:hypothetical protein SO802_028449 [Lithocarpus litseifolius]|uniref:CCHC-type domain-containing protein n=1 Tax=Lithocarpus litseifolius TaxID=425828 RepID=A0AAW2BTI5_9ROSI